MLDKKNISENIEGYINNHCEWKKKDLTSNPHDNFLIRNAERLKSSFDLYKTNTIFYDDFLCSLRNYLLSVRTPLSLRNIDQTKFKQYGLYIEDGTKKINASCSLPKYLDNQFIRDSFLNDYYYSEHKDSNSNLCSDGFIKNLTGFSSFRSESQKLSVYGALHTPEGYTTLISLPTGGGKSLITQAVAYQNDGLTIVIVPTVSLSIDQERVSKNTIKRENTNNEIFSYSSGVNPKPIIDAIKNKIARLLFISPEALILNSSFRDAIEEANKKKYLKNIVIDEAHIVTDWGALFRIDYQCLESWRDDLMVSNSKIRTFLLSATIEKKSRDVLKDLFSNEEKWIEIRCDELRKEPRYIYIEAKNLNDKKEKIIQMVKLLPHPIIVYISSPYEAEQLKNDLIKVGFNNVKTFTGKTNNKKRKELIDDWTEDKFEIMIATSAFGVGVDKPDVRSVIHAYIPQNPNAYYQELGRGGRDRLPSLSVMCVSPKNDLNSSFQKVNKKIMTTEKMCARWVAMYNDPKSYRSDNICLINTSIKPGYRQSGIEDEEGEFYDTSADADMNWNIYVILFLRRYNLIDIQAVRYNEGTYLFQISNIHSNLMTKNKDDQVLNDTVDSFRQEESDYYKSGINDIKKSIEKKDNLCWSEMFYKLYELIDEYCGGCPFHQEVVDKTSGKYTLKRAINKPIMNNSKDIESIFPMKESVIITKKTYEIVSKLIDLGANLILSENSIFELCPDSADKKNICHTLNRSDLNELLQKDNSFFLSGTMLAVYPNNQEKYNYIRTMGKIRNNAKELKIIHILEEDIRIETDQKSYTDYLDAPVYTAIPINKLG